MVNGVPLARATSIAFALGNSEMNAAFWDRETARALLSELLRNISKRIFPGWMTLLPCDYSARSPQTTASFSRLAKPHGKALAFSLLP